MSYIQEKLFAMADEKYALFQIKLTPGLTREKIIGVRMPQLRALAKELRAEGADIEAFLDELPHKYYDENQLHSILLSGVKDYETAMRRVDEFLPFVDNWAVCDGLRPKVFEKHLPELLAKIPTWLASSESFTIRFGIEMLMNFFLDSAFEPAQLELAAAVKSEEYYVNMMLAWHFATALAKQWEAAIPYLEQRRLPEWVHRKTIQKAIESYRITDAQKTYLRSLK